MDNLIESFGRLRSEAKERMSDKEFRQVEEKVHQLANEVRASRGKPERTCTEEARNE